jgi:protein ImuB
MGAAAPDAATPLVLVGQTGRRREVVAANAAAFQAGLRIGTPATQAQALVAELVIHHADPAADAEALERLAVWALRYSPLVAADAPDGLVIDATGATHLHGGEDAMLAGMISRLEAAGIAARAAIADTRGAAHGLARFAARPSLVVPERESAERIKPCRSRRCAFRETLSTTFGNWASSGYLPVSTQRQQRSGLGIEGQ